MSQDAKYNGRIHSWQLKLIDQAAEWDGLKRSTFMVGASVEKARKVFKREGVDVNEFIKDARAEAEKN